jgi:uncharacterized protein YqjF (DUF2071 family)
MIKTFLKARWENLVMANYKVDPEILLPHLPAGVQLDHFQNDTYVSLVGFMFRNTRIFSVPVPLWGTFEEINLRFYVVRKEGNELKRGVVFISESVPYAAVAYLANGLYNERYNYLKTDHSLITQNNTHEVAYKWQFNNSWNSIQATTSATARDMQPGSMEWFIFEHYYGYTRVNDTCTTEYTVHHPVWQVYDVHRSDIQCDFGALFGAEFSFLNNQAPHSVFHAAGSPITVGWRRNKLAVQAASAGTSYGTR